MNLKSIEDKVFGLLGKQDTGNRLNWRRQNIRDGANTAVLEIVQSMPWTWQHIKEFDLELVAGTDVYRLDDSVRRPLFLWQDAQTNFSQRIRFVNYERSTYDGERGSGAAFSSLGPWNGTWAPRSAEPDFETTLDGAIADGVLTITVNDTPDADHVDRILRIGGDAHEYVVESVNVGAKTYTLNRAVKSRIDDITTSLNTDSVGPGYADDSPVVVGPKGAYNIRILPEVAENTTIHYSAITIPKHMILPTEEPDLPTEFHHLVWKGAAKHCALFNQDDKSWQMYKAEYEEAIESYRQLDVDTMPSNDPPRHGSILNPGNVNAVANDYQSRRYGLGNGIW